jgi:phosphoserine aminotransferase
VTKVVSVFLCVLRRLLGLEEKDTKHYLSGGASLEFLMVPYNLMKEGGKSI